MDIDKIYNEDCISGMQRIAAKSVDMIICDLPYGVLKKSNAAAKWDCVIPFDELWAQYTRIIKDNGAIVLFAQGMFTAKLMMSKPKLWRYNLVWNKNIPTGFLNANRMPLRCHEDICVFYKKLPVYHPQFSIGKSNHNRGKLKNLTNNCYGNFAMLTDAEIAIRKKKLKENAHGRNVSTYDSKGLKRIDTAFLTKPGSDYKYPKSIISIDKIPPSATKHPTQKPVDLIRWLIRSYSEPGDIILDNCMGSGTTAIAALQEGRHFLGFEKDEAFFNICKKRISVVQNILQFDN